MSTHSKGKASEMKHYAGKAVSRLLWAMRLTAWIL